MTRSPRIAPGGFSQIGPIAWTANQIGRRLLKIPQVQLLTTLGRNRRLFPFFGGYMGYFGVLSKIGLRHVELVILRVATLRGSDYEFNHHARMSVRAGVTDADRARVAEGPAAEGWTAKEKALLAAVDGFVTRKALSDEEYVELARHFDEQRIIEVLLLTGAYDSLATAIDILGLETEYRG